MLLCFLRFYYMKHCCVIPTIHTSSHNSQFGAVINFSALLYPDLFCCSTFRQKLLFKAFFNTARSSGDIHSNQNSKPALKSFRLYYSPNMNHNFRSHTTQKSGKVVMKVIHDYVDFASEKFFLKQWDGISVINLGACEPLE